MKLSDIRERVVYGVKLKERTDNKLEELLLEIQLDIEDAKTKLKNKKTIDKEIRRLLKLRKRGLDPGPRPKIIPPSKPKRNNNTTSGTFFNQEAVKEKPPKPQTPTVHKCEWIFKESKKDMKYLDDDEAANKFVVEYTKTSTYYCNKCLRETIVTRQLIVPVDEDMKAIEPEWY